MHERVNSAAIAARREHFDRVAYRAHLVTAEHEEHAVRRVPQHALRHEARPLPARALSRLRHVRGADAAIDAGVQPHRVLRVRVAHGGKWAITGRATVQRAQVEKRVGERERLEV